MGQGQFWNLLGLNLSYMTWHTSKAINLHETPPNHLQAVQTSRFSAARVPMDTCGMWYIGYLMGHKQCKHQDFQRPGVPVECGI
jgi:hypothetical protein